MNSSDSDADDFQSDEDSEYLPSSESDGTSMSIISETYENTSTSDGTLDIPVDSGIFDRMLRHDLSLKIVLKPKSTSKIWNYFGYLLYKLVLISKVSNKVYCKICFDSGYLKRYTMLYHIVNMNNLTYKFTFDITVTVNPQALRTSNSTSRTNIKWQCHRHQLQKNRNQLWNRFFHQPKKQNPAHQILSLFLTVDCYFPYAEIWNHSVRWRKRVSKNSGIGIIHHINFRADLHSKSDVLMTCIHVA